MPIYIQTTPTAQVVVVAVAPTLSYFAVIASHAAVRPRHPAIFDRHGVSLDYGNLHDASTRFARLLSQHGVRRGDVVAIAQQPSAMFFVTILATMLIGAVAAPLHRGLSGPELQRYVDPLQLKVIVADSESAALAGDLGTEVLVTKQVSSTAELLATLPAEGHAASAFREGDIAMVFPTGGTTGLPKGAVVSHRAVWLWVSHLGNANRRRSDIELSLSPWFHVTLLAGPMSTLFAGGTIRVLPRFDPEDALEEIAAGANTMAATPTVYRRLLSTAGFEELAPRLRRLVYGATGSDERFVRSMLTAFPSADISTVYGATEFGSVTKVTRADLDAGRLHGVGRPVPSTSVRVVDDELLPVPPGVEGELLVTAPWQASGYWGFPEESATTFTPHGVRLGDVGVFDDDGWLTLRGRTKEMIISGGENIFPLDVEDVLARHPAIADVTVYGRPDEDWGERVEAAVVVRPGMRLNGDEVIAYASTMLGRLKVPKSVRFLERLPVTANNKPDRRALLRDAESQSSYQD